MKNNLYIEYDDQKIECLLEKSNRKTICIIVKENGDVIVKAPKRALDNEILKFVNNKKKWIYTKHNEQKNKFTVNTFEQGDKLKILGIEYELEIKYIANKKAYCEIIGNKFIAFIPAGIEDEKSIIEKIYNNHIISIANKEIPIIMEKICKMVGLYPKELKIRNFKRAWGNCSSKKIISINKNLCKYGKKEIEYVCLHEVCHLKHMNHSKDFWDMVKFYMPDYKIAEKNLKS